MDIKDYDINDTPCMRNGYIWLSNCVHCKICYDCDYFNEHSGYLYDGYDCD